MNIGVLIKEVQQREPLWDSSHNDHNNRVLIEKLWLEVAAAVNVNLKEIRQKWKCLRDQHRREMKKISACTPAGIPIYEPTWKYFKQLYFLNSQIPQKTRRNDVSSCEPEHVELLNTTSLKTYYWEGDEPAISEETIQSASSSSYIQQDYEDQNIKTKRSQVDVNRDLLLYLVELEKKKVDLLLAQGDVEKRERCDDFYFMSSILPIMKNFSDIQKLRVRSKILEVLMSEVNGDDSVANPQSS